MEFVLDIDDDEDVGGIVPSKNFVDVDVIFSNGGARGVPTYDFLPRIDFSHHIKHILMVNMVKKPDIGFILFFFEWHSEAISDLKDVVISVFTH